MKMISVIWFLSCLALFVADDKMAATPEKDVVPVRCRRCQPSNVTDCEVLENLTDVICPPELPYCATTAKSPDFASSLNCSARALAPCALIQKLDGTYEMTCTCVGYLCNAPFNLKIRNELLNFASTNSPDNDSATLLVELPAFSRIAAANAYAILELKREFKMNTEAPSLSSSLLPKVFENSELPRAEALKHEATVPPDDDEDENEGSGAFEDAKPQIPAAPAAPSSFLPANENTAIPVHINFLATIPFITLYAAA